MKLKYTYAISQVAGKTVAVPINSGKGTQNVIKTNQTGAFILKLLKDDITIPEIIAKIKETYAVESDEALEMWVNKFIDNLKSIDALVY